MLFGAASGVSGGGIALFLLSCFLSYSCLKTSSEYGVLLRRCVVHVLKVLRIHVRSILSSQTYETGLFSGR